MCHPLLLGYLYFCVIWTKIGDFAPTHVHKRWEQEIKVLQNGTCVLFCFLQMYLNQVYNI